MYSKNNNIIIINFNKEQKQGLLIAFDRKMKARYLIIYQ